MRALCLNFVSTLVSGFEDCYAVAETGNSLCTVLPQSLGSEWQIAISPAVVYGHHRFVLMLQCFKLLNKARIHQELF